MALDIDKKKYFRTSGNQNSNGMAFYNNEWVFNREKQITPHEFYLPSFCGQTGTYAYYDQTSASTLNLYGRVDLNFYATGTTASTLPQGYVQNAWLDDRLRFTQFDIYKIPFQDSQNQEKVSEYLRTPYIQYTATTATTRSIALSGEIVSDTFRYSFLFSPSQTDKPNQGFTEVIFNDRSQYFLNPVYSFYDQNPSFNSAFTADTNNVFRSSSYTGLTSFTTKGRVHKIQQGSWAGHTCQGLFFVALQPANKPKIENPLPTGDTFTPAFFFSNVEDGDEYVLEVEYGTGGTFSNPLTIEQYFRKKSESSQEQVIEYKNTDESNTSARVNKTTSVRTRRIEAALLTNQSYCWRIGNIKFITDIFGIKRSITTYSDVNCSITEATANVGITVDNEYITQKAPQIPTGGGNQTVPPQNDGDAVK